MYRAGLMTARGSLARTVLRQSFHIEKQMHDQILEATVRAVGHFHADHQTLKAERLRPRHILIGKTSETLNSVTPLRSTLICPDSKP
jgi:hypothetical protein